MTAYAHSLPEHPPEQWEPLFTSFGAGEDQCQGRECQKCQALDRSHGHLNKVAWWAAKFATEMFAPDSPEAKSAWEWGYLAGLWHDLGKFSKRFQNYLEKSTACADPHGEDVSATGGRVDHSSAGAQHSSGDERLGPLMGYGIAGHHAGLPDGVELRERLLKQIPDWKEFCPEDAKAGVIPDPPLSKPTEGTPSGAFRLAFHLRMMFSALVDADSLCTEAFMSPDKTAQRQVWPDNVLERMENALKRHLDAYGTSQSLVDKERLHVRHACETAAMQDLGFFDLTVPTGGGKTLSSLMFALRHARKHGLHRVVCAIPFTSIIEQNAEVYRDVFKELSMELGREIVLEHHSNLQPDRETTQNSLASENWDAPLIVTTNVQLFESLFACRRSQCRKLHRLAQSVIILDEAQALPVCLLRPVLLAMRCLVHDFRSSIVLCTATQPALEKREGFDPGIPAEIIRPIIKDRVRLYESLRRTRVEALGSQTNEDLKTRVFAAKGGSLIVVNTTKAARDLYSCLDFAEIRRFHLSARMCPEHRSAVLSEVKHLLAKKQPVALVSTQIIEAGVDVSFPAVFRAECGLDSLAQAAGRCNRNGELRDESGNTVLGRVYSFQHNGYDIPQQLVDLRSASADAAQIAPRYRDDILSLEAIEHFFRLHIWTVGQGANQWDQPDVTGCFPPMAGKDWQFTIQFREAAKRFQMVPQVTCPLVIPWGEKGKALCKELRERDRIGISPARAHYRRAQRFTVQVYDWEWQRLISENLVESLLDGALHILIHPENDYDEAFGLRPPNSPSSPFAFMV